jgi:hypothetical protein
MRLRGFAAPDSTGANKPAPVFLFLTRAAFFAGTLRG